MYPNLVARALATNDYKSVVKVDQLTYLIGLVLLATWKDSPTFNTLHELRKKFVMDPKNNPVLNKMRAEMAENFTVADIYTAAAEAFHEFRDRIGKLYLVTKVIENGDLEEYQEAMKTLETQIQEIKNRKTNLILPKV